MADSSLDKLHHLAVRNFKSLQRISWMAGCVIAAVAVAMYVIDFLSETFYPMNSVYGIVRYGLTHTAMWLIVYPLMRRRLLPIDRPRLTAVEQKIYREWLYYHARPIPDIWWDFWKAILFTLPFFIIVGLYVYIYFNWPEYRISGLVVGGILIFIAIYAMVQYYIEPQRTRSQAWIAEHFPPSDVT